MGLRIHCFLPRTEKGKSGNVCVRVCVRMCVYVCIKQDGVTPFVSKKVAFLVCRLYCFFLFPSLFFSCVIPREIVTVCMWVYKYICAGCGARGAMESM